MKTLALGMQNWAERPPSPVPAPPPKYCENTPPHLFTYPSHLLPCPSPTPTLSSAHPTTSLPTRRPPAYCHQRRAPVRHPPARSACAARRRGLPRPRPFLLLCTTRFGISHYSCNSCNSREHRPIRQFRSPPPAGSGAVRAASRWLAGRGAGSGLRCGRRGFGAAPVRGHGQGLQQVRMGDHKVWMGVRICRCAARHLALHSDP